MVVVSLSDGDQEDFSEAESQVEAHRYNCGREKPDQREMSQGHDGWS